MTPRRVYVALIAAGLAIGIALGLSSERFAPLLSPGSALSVFDGDPADDDRWVNNSYSPSAILDSRRIGTVGAADIFAVRTTVDLSTGVTSGEPLICVVGDEEGLYFSAAGCLPEPVFRTQGFRGVLSAIDIGTLFTSHETRRLLSVVWHPSGALEITDLTDDVVVSQDDLYTDAEREAGLDIRFIDSLRHIPVEPDVDSFVAEMVSPAELGPGSIGSGSGSGVRASHYLSVHEGAEPDALRVVCLTVRVNDELQPPACESLAVFREVGVSVDVVEEGVRVFAHPREGIGFDISQRETR